MRTMLHYGARGGCFILVGGKGGGVGGGRGQGEGRGGGGRGRRGVSFLLGIRFGAVLWVARGAGGESRALIKRPPKKQTT